MKKRLTLVSSLIIILTFSLKSQMIIEIDIRLSADRRIQLPFSGSLDLVVDWGDGIVINIHNHNNNYVHTYSNDTIYTISITGQLFQFGKGANGYIGAEKITKVKSFGDLNLSSLSGAFFNAKNLVEVPDQIPPDVSNLSFMFSGASLFNQDIGNWDVSSVYEFQGMFREADEFNQDIGNWDVGNAYYMYSMFANALKFNQDIGQWNVGNVANMAGMFYNAPEFNQNIGNWDVSNVNDMDHMFAYAVSFNQDIGNWDTSNVIYMTQMFNEAVSFNQDIGNWDVGNVTIMAQMFHHARSFNQDIGNWNVGKVTNMTFMFCGSEAFNQDIGRWDVKNVEDMSFMFFDVSLFSHDISNWEVGGVKDMNLMFHRSGLTDYNYGLLLEGWAKQTLQKNVSFDAGDAKYYTGGPSIARQSIISNFNWSITDGGQITSVNDYLSNETRIFPNPVQDVLNIETHQGIKQIIITDIKGKKIFTSNTIDLTIDTSTWANGNYIMVVDYTGGKSDVFKIVK